MGRTVFELVSPAPAFDGFPINVRQVAASSAASSRILLLLPAIAALSILLAGVAIAAAADPGMLGAVVQRPLASLQIAAGLGIWAALFVVPASRAIGAIGRRRDVSIDDGIVEITDRSLLGHRTRSARVADYLGIAHHIRASLSGLNHEIVLVHADPVMTVTLVSGDRVTQAMLDAAKSALGLPEIPARAIYERVSGPTAGVGVALETARA